MFYIGLIDDPTAMDWLHRVKREMLADLFRDGKLVVPGHVKADMEPPSDTLEEAPLPPKLSLCVYTYKGEEKTPKGLAVPDHVLKTWCMHAKYGETFTKYLEDTKELAEAEGEATTGTSTPVKRAGGQEDLGPSAKKAKMEPGDLLEYGSIPGTILMEVPFVSSKTAGSNKPTGGGWEKCGGATRTKR
jgi:hypothetical protein